MGILKRGGTYYAEFFDVMRTPQAKRFSLRTKKKDEARRRYVDLERDWERGKFNPWRDNPRTYREPAVEPQTRSLSEAIQQFVAKKEADDKSENTVTSYSCILKLLLRLAGDMPIDRLTAAHIEPFIRDRTLKLASQHMRFRHVRAFVRWCIKKKYISTNPLDDVEPPQKPDKLPKALTERELKLVCDTVQADYDDKRGRGVVQEGELIWRIPLFRFAFYTGMRPAELARLRWRDVDFEARLIYIHKQKNKREQTIPLNRKAAEILSTVQQGDSNDYIFRPPYATGQVRSSRCFVERASRAFAAAKRDAGIQRQVSLYGTRHGFCTKLAEVGKPLYIIKEAARHANVSTTMTYIHLANEHLKAELDDVFD